MSKDRSVTKRRYPRSKVRSGDQEDIPQVQGQGQRLALLESREEMPQVQGKKNCIKAVEAERRLQRANRLKPQSQKTNQSNYMDHSLV